MKKGFIFIFFSAIVSMAAFAQQPAQQPVQQVDTTVVFNKLVHDFGDITKNDGDQSYTFEFTNKGSHPVIIQKVTTSCGCTTPSWTKEPVAPGKKGYVTATYKPSAVTTINKSITVQVEGGTPAIIILQIRGNVVE